MEPNTWTISRKNWFYRFNRFMSVRSEVTATTRREFIFTTVSNIILLLVTSYIMLDACHEIGRGIIFKFFQADLLFPIDIIVGALFFIVAGGLCIAFMAGWIAAWIYCRNKCAKSGKKKSPRIAFKD